MKKFFLFAATLLGLVACNKNEADINVPARQITIHATANVNNGGAANGPHRIAPNDITASSVSFHWQEGDKIWVLSKNFSEKQIFTIDNGSINGNQANFTGTALSDMSSYYVIYLDNIDSEETLMASIFCDNSLIFNYNPDSKNWLFMGEGVENSFTLGCTGAIRMQLKGTCKLGKVVYIAGDPAEVDDSDITTTLNFVHDEYDGLQLTSTPVEVVISLNLSSMDGFTLRFYDIDGNLIMEKSKEGSSLSNDLDNYGLVNLGVLEVADPYNGHAYVDLGLPSGLKWATCNVGATTPEGYGDYFAWGETETKTTYSAETYTYTDNPTTLPLDHDAARVKWGGNWRMPTKAEQDELREKCTWTPTQKNDINGYEVIGSNGNSIFLPASGYRNGSSLNSVGSYGYYWSSSLHEYYSSYACILVFSGNVDWIGSSRSHGRSVRPVCQ